MNKKAAFVMKFLGSFLLLYIFSFASINGIIYPFAFSFAFSLVWCGEKVWAVMIAYAGASLVHEFSLANGIVTLSTLLFLIMPFIFHFITKKKVKLWGQIVCLVLSKLVSLVFINLTLENIIYFILTIGGGVLFFLACIKAFSYFDKKLWHKPTNLDIICISLFAMFLSAGVTNFSIGKFEFVKLFVPLSILIISYCLQTSTAILSAFLLAVGTVMPAGNTMFLAPILLWSLGIVTFKTHKKIFSIIALYFAEVVSGIFFNFYYTFGIIEALPVVIAGLMFLLLPNQLLDKIKDVYEAKKARLALKNMYNEERELLGRRLENLSNVFYEMNLVFRAMIKRSLSQEEMSKMLYKELKKSVCEACPEKTRCHRTFCEDTQKSFDEMNLIALKKGKISLLDIPSFLSTRCGKLNLLIAQLNSLCVQYKRYSEIMGSLDTSKLLVAEQLYGISGVIKNLSKEMSLTVSFDMAREEKIKDELNFHNIVCSDAIVYDKDIHTKEVSILVRNEDEDKDILPKVVSEVCEAKMIVSNRNSAITPGWTNLTLKTAPRYDCLFGLATLPKTGNSMSGDSHSEIRLSENKFLFAICDGMGNGAKANETSTIAINLIENFYKAGFDNETILSSVNNLLLLEKEENFSAIDVCVLDLASGIVDIIKMGSPSGYILSPKEVKVVEGEALPLGIASESKPSIKKYVVEENEFIVLMSDGISDSFASDRHFADFLSRQTSLNPQEVADEILGQAIENNGGIAQDDMSVLVIKLFRCQ